MSDLFTCLIPINQNKIFQVNYDQKSQEAETKSREYNTACEELSQKQSQLNSMQSELQSIKESATHQRKRINEMLRSLLTDLGEVGTLVSKNDLKKPDSPANETKVEEEFTVARLYVSKMKSEVKNLVNKASMLETAQGNCLLFVFRAFSSISGIFE